MIDLKALKFTDLLGDVEPVEPADPIEPESEPDPVEPVKPVEPKKKTVITPDPVDPVDPIEEPEETDPVEPAEPTDEPTVISNLATSLGHEFEDGEEYEDNEEGLTAFVTKAAERRAGAQLLEFFAQFPEVEEFARFKINGGDSSKYYETLGQTSLTTLELKEDDTATHKLVVDKFLTKQGYDETERAEMITDYEDTGLLFKQAKGAQAKLNKLDASEKQATLAAQQKIKDKEIADNKTLWTNVETTVTEGVIKGIKIPDTEKKKFFEWMSKPVDKQGRSQREIAREALDVETMVALEYLQYKNFDLGKLVMAKVNTLQAKELRERLGAGGQSKKLGGTTGAPVRKPGTLPSFKDLL